MRSSPWNLTSVRARHQSGHAACDHDPAHQVRGVPFFVLGGRYGVSGAQSPEVFAQAIERALSDES